MAARRLCTYHSRHWLGIIHSFLLLSLCRSCFLPGTGTFGRVKLVQHAKTRVAMAMKCLRKTQVVAARQQNNIMYEKNCMAVMDHPFVLKLHGTWQDANQLYMFMEIVQGGELWSLLYQKEVRKCTESCALRSGGRGLTSRAHAFPSHSRLGILELVL